MSIASEIDGDYCKGVAELGCDFMPYVVGLREAVEQEERWASARTNAVDCDVVLD